MTTALIVIRILFYLIGGIEAIRRRNYITWAAFIFFIVANTIFGFGISGSKLDFFRTLGAIALVYGYTRRR